MPMGQCPFNPLTPKHAQNQNSRKIPNFILQNTEKKQMVPCESTAGEVSFEWLHHRILFTDSKVRTTLHVSRDQEELPIPYMYVLFFKVFFLLFFLKLLQIVANFRNGHTGQLSFIMVLLLFLGAMARIFTTLQETGDMVMLVSFLVSTALNGTLVFQVLYYWNVKPALKKKTA